MESYEEPALSADYGFKDHKGTQWLLSFWPCEAGITPEGFDVDAWEAAQTHISAVPGANPKEAWREAYRVLRVEARKLGGFDWMERSFPDKPAPLPN